MSAKSDLIFIINMTMSKVIAKAINEAVDKSGITKSKKYIDNTNKLKDILEKFTGININRREYEED